MILRFIGTDGSMGLQNNRIYEVKVIFLQNEIWIEVYAGSFKRYIVHMKQSTLLLKTGR